RDRENGFRFSARDAPARVLDGHSGNALNRRIDEVDDPRDGLDSHARLRCDGCYRALRRSPRRVFSSSRRGAAIGETESRKMASRAATPSSQSTPAGKGTGTDTDSQAAMGRGGLPRALLSAARPSQWVKNLVVPLPFLFGHALGTPRGWAL